MKWIWPAIAIAAGLSVAPAMADDQHFTGEVFAAPSYCPEGSLAANGATLEMGHFQALFSIVGNRYGGDGKKTFALPKLTNTQFGGPRARTQWCIAVDGNYPVPAEHQP